MATAKTLDTFDPVWDRLVVHLRRAGRQLARPITDVRVGEPASVAAPMIALWYDGQDEGELIPHTLVDASYTERVVIRWYWPVPDRTPAVTDKLERTVRRALRATTRALMADRQLGGACADLRFVERSQAGWIDLQPGWCRIVTHTLGVEMADEDTIAAGG